MPLSHYRKEVALNPDFDDRLDTIAGLIHFPMQELSGTTLKARVNGVYNSAYDGTIVNATIGQTFAGNIPYCQSLDASGDYNNIYSAALNTAFDPDEFTILQFINSTDFAAARYSLGISAALATDHYGFRVSAGGAFLWGITRGGDGDNSLSSPGILSPATNYMVGMTLSKSANTVSYLLNRDVVATDTVKGTWAGPLNAALCVIGALSTTLSPFLGLITETIIHPKRAMAYQETSEIYDWSGI